MAMQTVMPIQILNVGPIREFKDTNGRVTQRRTLQCFTGDVVGEHQMYLSENQPDISDAGQYTAIITWGNYQGKLTPRISKIEPRSAAANAAKEVQK